jgi:predicted GNAT family acetyltransferase
MVNNEEKQRFEIALDEEFAFIEYRWHDGNIVLMHTEVPESMRGKGIAQQLAKQAFEYVRDNNLQAVVYCPFLLSYLKKHPEYSDVVVNA